MVLLAVRCAPHRTALAPWLASGAPCMLCIVLLVCVASAARLVNRCPACVLYFLGLQRKDGQTPRPRVITGVRVLYQSHWCVSLQATGCAPGSLAHLSCASLLLITLVPLAAARALSAQVASRALSGLSYGPRMWLCDQDSHTLGSDGSAPDLTGWHPSRTTCLTYAEVWMQDGGHGHGHVQTLTQRDSSILNVGRKKREDNKTDSHQPQRLPVAGRPTRRRVLAAKLALLRHRVGPRQLGQQRLCLVLLRIIACPQLEHRNLEGAAV